MNVEVGKTKVIIELPLEEPRPSSTGRTILIASTGGVKQSTAKYEGRLVSVVANVLVAPKESQREELEAWRKLSRSQKAKVLRERRSRTRVQSVLNWSDQSETTGKNRKQPGKRWSSEDDE